MPDPTVHEPWEKIISFQKSSLVTRYDGADIADEHLQVVEDFFFDNAVLEKTKKPVALNGTPLEGGTHPIQGVWRSHNQKADKVTLTVCNKKLKRWTGAAFADVYTFNNDERTDFLNWEDQTIIINGKDDALSFDPSNNTVQKFGLEPGHYYKRIAYFESDEALTQVTATAVKDAVFVKNRERSGDNKYSLKLTSVVGTPAEGYIVPLASSVDLAQFPNGLSTSDNDMICLSILHRILNYVDYVEIDFWTSTGNYFRLTVDGTELDQKYARDNQWTDIIARRSRCVTVGDPTWFSISRVYFRLYAQTGTSTVYIDNVYLKNAPIEVTRYKVAIENFEGGIADWVKSGGTLSDNANTTYIREGTKSLKYVGGTQNFYKNISAKDLSIYTDGVPIPTSDLAGVEFWGSTTNLTSIELRFYSDTATPKYFTKTFTVAGGDFKKSSAGAWTRLEAARSVYTDFAGAGAVWTSIIRMAIFITMASGSISCFFDDMSIREAPLRRSMATMEGSEAWSFSGTGGFNNDKTKLTEGFSSIYLKVPRRSTYTATLTLGSPVNLNQFSGGEVSGVEDLIAFWAMWDRLNPLEKIKLQIDCNLGDFSTDYYEVEWDKGAITNLAETKVTAFGSSYSVLPTAKGDFIRIGETGGRDWSTAKAYRLSVTAVDTFVSPVSVYFDDLHLIRRSGLTGIYQWCMVFESPKYKSAPSEFSTQITLDGTKALLTNLPMAPASEPIMARHFFRKGGNNGATIRLDFSIYDNTTTSLVTSTSDEATGDILDLGASVPDGTIRVPLGAKFGPIFKNRATMYRDPSDLRSLYFSNSKYFYAWSEAQRIRFDSEVLNVSLTDDILYVSTTNGVRRIAIDLAEAGPQEIEETGLVKYVVSPWASCDAEEMTALVAYDGAYVFDGQSFKYLTEAVRTFFDEATYTLANTILFYSDQHLYISLYVTATGVRKLLDLYIPGLQFRTSDDVINAFCIFDGPGDNGEIYVGDQTGTVYKFGTAYSDSAQAVTKDYGADDPFVEIVLTDISVIYKSLSSSAGQIQIQFREDQAIKAGISILFPATGNLPNVYTLDARLLTDVYATIKGHKIGLVIAHAVAGKHCAIEAIKLKGFLAPITKAYE